MKTGDEVKQDFTALSSLPVTEGNTNYQITDTRDGIDIRFANEKEQKESDASPENSTPMLNLSFPKDYSQPIDIKLDDRRTISITDISGQSDYRASTFSPDTAPKDGMLPQSEKIPEQNLWNRILSLGNSISKSVDRRTEEQRYVRYESKDGRKELLYSFQKDQATGEKKLKHWTLYREGIGVETESYQFKNAKIKINETGIAEVYYFGEQDIQNEKVSAEVDGDLMARAQRTLAKEMGEDILMGGQTPDFTIPVPYYIDKNGEKHSAEWKWNENAKTLSVNFTPDQSVYPIALDPTLSFVAPGQSNTGSAITGEASSYFGASLAAGDFNADGQIDLAVGAQQYSSITGRAYIFYNDGTLPTTAATADVTITGETTFNYFGASLAAGDWNADGRTDLAVGASGYSSNTGRTYIFYNDGTLPITADTADVTITGETTGNFFGTSLASGDFNADGRTDLVVGAYGYSSSFGRAYIFYNDGTIPTTAATADVTITGGAISNYFGYSLAAGDWNADGRTDLAVGAYKYSSNTGRTYIFYNDGTLPTTAATADVTITGEATNSYFGYSLTSGDFNADGRTDLAVGAQRYSAFTGRTYIFYNDGTIPTTAATADVIITGENTVDYFGTSLTSGDFNADGRTDLAVGAYRYSSITGRTYIFYNDGTIPTTAATADVTITGEAVSNYFGTSLASGDWNADGRTDLAVGAFSAGRAYIFYSQNGQVNTNQNIAGEATNNFFGASFASGDWNADGRTDLAVGAYGYSANTGRTYIFYNDGTIPTTAATADVTITGEANSSFGVSLTSGDWNADGRTDLAVGAFGYSSDTGRAYIFYNDGTIPTTAATADVTITGEANSSFGTALTAGDWNADGRTDLTVGAYQYSSDTGRAYIFYNDGTIPTTATTADVTITGETTYDYFGILLTAGDWNADGRTDLAISAYGYSSYTGRVYLFYNDGTIPTTAASADVIITGETTSNSFGYALTSGDFNADGRTDLAVGANAYSTSTGRAYIFYNDGTLPTTATTSDVTITGETGSSFGSSLAADDFNADGRTDLAVGASGYSTNTGRAYIFYNDGTIPTTAVTADVIITGEAGSSFGETLSAGDFNADGRTDLTVGAYGDSSNTGKVYVYETRENFAWKIQQQFYPSSATTFHTGLNTSGQEMKIIGEGTNGSFGYSLASGDWNSDGRTDLAVGATGYSSSTGRAYIFYNDGTLSTTAGSADVIITGETTNNYFGYSLASGDWNSDGRTDLAVGAIKYSSDTGRAYIFYNDGTIPVTAGTADVIITGEAVSNYFGYSLAAGDFNADGQADLVVGARTYSSIAGRAYIFYNDGTLPTTAATADITITGEASSSFGYSLTAGDFNADGRTDLSVSAPFYSTNTGRAYIFYNDGTIPTTAASADVIITGEITNNSFGTSLAAGDWNSDGRIDLVVGAYQYSNSTGRAYIFYNDGTLPTTAATADITITGQGTSTSFGKSLAAGDWNADGRTDLAVGAIGSIVNTGRAYIFYNDGTLPTTAGTADVTITGELTTNFFGDSLASGDFNADGRTDLAVGADGINRMYMYTFNDVTITGEAINNFFGKSLISGDFNADGRIDLVVGAYGYSANTGRTYIFYNDGTLPTTAATADVTITGEANSSFGYSLASGDWNADGRTDLAVGAYRYSTFTGRAYIFYNDGTLPTTAASADITITGETTNNYFGYSLASGDFNADGRTDLAVGASQYSSNTGRAYIFYNDGTIPTTAATADVIITGEASSSFGIFLTAGDFNADGRTDLAVGASQYSSNTGRAYIFYNDGTLPTTAASADITITGETTNNSFGTFLVAGDWDADGRTDLAVGAHQYVSYTGRAYIFYNDGTLPTTAATADITITGEATNNFFGKSLISGDFNADGRTDLAVSAYGYSFSAGRAYIFYNDGTLPTTAATADITITGEANSAFGYSLSSGDWNADGRTDLAAGASDSSSSTGRMYIILSEATVKTTPDVTLIRGVIKSRGSVKIR